MQLLAGLYDIDSGCVVDTLGGLMINLFEFCGNFLLEMNFSLRILQLFSFNSFSP